MSTCPSCHQSIPFSCDRDGCHDQIIVVDGVPMSYQNHHKKHAAKKLPVHIGKASIVTPAEQKSFDKAVAKAEEDG